MNNLYDTIIVGVDESAHADVVLKKALKVAAQVSVPLIIVSTIAYNEIMNFSYGGIDAGAISRYAIPNQEEMEALIKQRRSFVQGILANADTTNIPQIQKVLEIEDPQLKILELAKVKPNALIVIGASSKKTLERFFIGSIARQIIDRASVDVLLVR